MTRDELRKEIALLAERAKQNDFVAVSASLLLVAAAVGAYDEDRFLHLSGPYAENLKQR